MNETEKAQKLPTKKDGAEYTIDDVPALVAEVERLRAKMEKLADKNNYDDDISDTKKMFCPTDNLWPADDMWMHPADFAADALKGDNA